MCRAITLLFIPLLLLAGVGCDDKKPFAPKSEATSEQVAFAGGNAPADGLEKKGNAANPADPNVERKVILNVQMEITVASVEDTNQKILELVKQSKGYVIKSEETARTFDYRQTVWKIRVPAKSLDSVTDSLRQLGTVTRRNLESKDVTEEYYDLEARLKHWKGEEETLLKLMKEKAQTTEDILKFRTQITSVRENIDRMEARISTIRLLTEMSTIDLTIRDRDRQIPDEEPSKPTTTVGRTFAASIATLQEFGHNLLIFFVGITPWLPLILISLFLIRLVKRRLLRPQIGNEPPPLGKRSAAIHPPETDH